LDEGYHKILSIVISHMPIFETAYVRKECKHHIRNILSFCKENRHEFYNIYLKQYEEEEKESNKELESFCKEDLCSEPKDV